MLKGSILVVSFLLPAVFGVDAGETGPANPAAPAPPTVAPPTVPGPTAPTPYVPGPAAPALPPHPSSPTYHGPYPPSPVYVTPAPAMPPGSGPNSIAPALPPLEGDRAPLKCQRLVYRLRAVPAIDAARALEQLLRAEEKRLAEADLFNRVVLVPNTIGNSILVSGPRKDVRVVVRLLDELDRPPVMVRLEFSIAEVKDQEPAQVLARGELTTLDNQSASLQVGRREPKVTGTSVSAKGMANSITMEDVGTRASFVPRVGPDSVVTLELDLEDSRLGPVEEGTPVAVTSEGETIRTPHVETFVCQSTVRIANGETVTLAGMSRGNDGSESKRVVQITARVLPVGDEKNTKTD